MLGEGIPGSRIAVDSRYMGLCAGVELQVRGACVVSVIRNFAGLTDRRHGSDGC